MPNFNFSEIEKRDLLISWITLSIAFTFLFASVFQLGEFAGFLPISFVAVGTGFVFHEVAHRTAARHYGCVAEYRMWKEGLMLALILPIITFGRMLFAAPGAVYIYGPHLTRKQNGIISLAGPLTNIGVAGLSVALLFAMPQSAMAPVFATVLGAVFSINLWLALFNMIPFPPLDGSKIIAWNPLIWGIVFFPLAAIIFF